MMNNMENIFKNAKFGDKFLTRDGKVAIYVRCIEQTHRLVLEDEIDIINWYNSNGSICVINREEHDIVSKYIDSIDESWMEEKAIYSMPHDIKESNDYIQGWIDGAKYVMN